ncbi:unnamed protein product [Cuscuta epithymum]|uniref:Uncharacterized protein n=1 Tax=Cuscuta epithymum TaxID=186058 RepID=A0AAV0FCX7_9ASTE|nr:unnamed protein product [Cuscuta epithymum]CAH9133241.1 unnamed protein product [Cuscuta epithymum]
MDDIEFHRLLEHFPVIRTRDYHHETEMMQSTSLPSRNLDSSRSARNLEATYSSRNLDTSKSSRSLETSKSSKKLATSKSSRNFSTSRSSRNLASSRSSRKLITSKTLLREFVERVNKGGMETKNTDNHDAFWDKVMLVAEKQLGAEEAEKFCKSFQEVYKKLVFEELSLDAARKFLNSP